MEHVAKQNTQVEDEVLCRLAAEGDPRAEEEMVCRYRRLVRICARPLFLVGGDSEDLIQEGMVGLLSAIRNFNSNESATFRTYAEVCIKNRLRSAIRAASRGKHAPLNDAISFETPLFDMTNGVLIATEDTPEERIIGQETLAEQLDHLKGQMSGFESEVLSRYLEGYTCSEIAQQMSKTSKSVDNAVQRIRKKLVRSK